MPDLSSRPRNRFWPIRTIVDWRHALHTEACLNNRIFMCRALVTIAFGAAMMAASFSAPAHKAEFSLPVQSTAKSDVLRGSECHAADNGFRSEAVLIPEKQLASGQVVSLTYRGTDRLSPVPVQSAAASSSVGSHANWRSTAALLSTLALIGTIALRRYKAGKS